MPYGEMFLGWLLGCFGTEKKVLNILLMNTYVTRAPRSVRNTLLTEFQTFNDIICKNNNYKIKCAWTLTIVSMAAFNEYQTGEISPNELCAVWYLITRSDLRLTGSHTHSRWPHATEYFLVLFRFMYSLIIFCGCLCIVCVSRCKLFHVFMIWAIVDVVCSAVLLLTSTIRIECVR